MHFYAIFNAQPQPQVLEMEKKCGMCGYIKDEAQFGRDGSEKSRLRKQCKKCIKLLNALRYKVRERKMTKEAMREQVNRYKCQMALDRLRAQTMETWR
jgi:hypothetical protein